MTVSSNYRPTLSQYCKWFNTFCFFFNFKKMPRFSLDTNLPASKIPEEFLSSCTTLLSKSLGKRQSVSIM